MLSRFYVRAKAFLSDENGPTAVEYAVMLALMVVVFIATIAVLGTNSNNTFKRVSTSLNSGS
jgi:pilus assembly protein Flp/PilA